jgi:putative salt-induced outer membrane protein
MRVGAMLWAVLGVVSVLVVDAHAQAPLPPITMPPSPGAPWVATVSGGLALTSGNRDTSTLNMGYDFLYDPQTRNRIKSDALYIHGRSDGQLSADRLGFNARDEYKVREDGAFVFGQLQFVRDRFKQINYIWAPTGGLGYRLVESPRTMVSIDTGLGAVWEKNPGVSVKKSVAVTVSEKLTHRLSQNATLTQSLSALYKTNNFADSLYVFGTAVASSMTTRTQLKVEVIDTYKNRVIFPAVVNNDVALVVALVYKR